MCEGCRHSSHPNHSFGYIADLAVVERARLTAVGTQCGTLAQLLQSRLDELHHASKTCAQSAEDAVQELRRWMDEVRAALERRQQQLTNEIRQIQQVWFKDHSQTLF